MEISAEAMKEVYEAAIGQQAIELARLQLKLAVLGVTLDQRMAQIEALSDSQGQEAE